MDDPVFRSARFDMRPWTRADRDLLHPIMGDPRVVFWDPEAGPVEHTAEVLDRIVAATEQDAPGRGWFAVTERATGDVVATVIVRTPAFSSPDAAGAVELGWHVRYERWGEGIATEVAEAAVAQAVDVLGERALVAIILPDNARSQRVAEKLGLVEVGETDYKALRHLVYRRELSGPRP